MRRAPSLRAFLNCAVVLASHASTRHSVQPGSLRGKELLPQLRCAGHITSSHSSPTNFFFSSSSSLLFAIFSLHPRPSSPREALTFSSSRSLHPFSRPSRLRCLASSRTSRHLTVLHSPPPIFIRIVHPSASSHLAEAPRPRCASPHLSGLSWPLASWAILALRRSTTRKSTPSLFINHH